jgi:hypothetical protein
MPGQEFLLQNLRMQLQQLVKYVIGVELYKSKVNFVLWLKENTVE